MLPQKDILLFHFSYIHFFIVFTVNKQSCPIALSMKKQYILVVTYLYELRNYCNVESVSWDIGQFGT